MAHSDVPRPDGQDASRTRAFSQDARNLSVQIHLRMIIRAESVLEAFYSREECVSLTH